MRIRKFRKEDAKGVSNVICRAQRETLAGVYPKKVIEKFCDWSSPSGVLKKSEKRDYWVALEETSKSVKKEKIIGICGIEKERIKTMFVHPNFHKKGVGRKLLKKVESVAKKRKIKLMRVESTTYAEPFYAKCGYERIRKNHVKFKGISFDVVRMKKKI